jgi:hypothetical protein
MRELLLMNLFYTQLKDGVRYALSDRNAIIVVGLMSVVASIVRKSDNLPDICNLFNLTIFFIIGYGSFISWYTLKGENRHPDLRNYKRIFWEGIKKSAIIAVYSIGLTFFKHHAGNCFSEGNYLLALALAVLFAANYILMIGGLFNRYLNHGKFFKAFDLPEIWRLFRIFDVASFIRVLIAVVIAQAVIVLIIIGFGKEFRLLEIAFSVAAVFLVPFLFFTTKRMVGLNVYRLLEKANMLRD